MHRALVVFVASMGLIAIGAAPASAAPTHPEYIAQADPICRSTIDAQRQAGGAKGFLGPLKHGHLKAAGRSMRRVFAAFSPGVEQLAALEPPVADAQLIATWVQDLRA